MRRGRFLRLLVGVAVSCGLAGPVAAQQVVVRQDRLQLAFGNGGTLVGWMNDRVWIEHYLPNGRYTGAYRGQSYAGRWAIEGDLFCTQVDGQPRACQEFRSPGSGPLEGRTDMIALSRTPGLPQMPVIFTHRAPGQEVSPLGSTSGVVLRVHEDSFVLGGSGPDGRPQPMPVVSGRRLPLRVGERVSVFGQTDGVTWWLMSTTREDGSTVR